MEDYKTWLYLLFAVIYFILQNRKKKKPQPNPNQEPARQPSPAPKRSRQPSIPQEDKPAERPKPITFQEVLREILEEEKPALPEKQKRRTEEPVQKFLPKYEPPKPREALKYEPLKASRAYKSIVEEDDDEIQNLEVATASTGLDESYLRGSLFKEFAHEGRKVNPYGEKLKRKSGVREAFVMSEILSRKEY